MHILFAVVVASIMAPSPLVSAPQEAIASRPTLPSLPDLDRWVAILEVLQPPPRMTGEVTIRPVQQEPILRGGFLAAARAMPEWGGEALVVARGVHSLEEVADAAGRPDLFALPAGWLRASRSAVGESRWGTGDHGIAREVASAPPRSGRRRIRDQYRNPHVGGPAFSAGRHRNRPSPRPAVRGFDLFWPPSAPAIPPLCAANSII